MVFLEGLGQTQDLFCINETLSIGNLFGTGNHQSLAFLHGLDKCACLNHGFLGPGVQPRHTPTQQFGLEAAHLEILGIDVCDFKLAPRRGLDMRGNLYDWAMDSNGKQAGTLVVRDGYSNWVYLSPKHLQWHNGDYHKMDDMLTHSLVAEIA